jgi:hypothetical protein
MREGINGDGDLKSYLKDTIATLGNDDKYEL